MCTRDAEYAKIMDSDSKEHRLATSKFLFNLAVAQNRAKGIRKEMKIPVLFMLAGNDAIVEPAASRKVFARLEAKDKELTEYPDMYHALTVDLDKEKVFGDMLRWIERRI
jgi:alpha-beta hydrolase superfamily lysophospholipase